MISKRVFAWLASRENRTYEKIVARRKQALFGSLGGTVVEIGAGSGANLFYLPEYIRYIAVEPNHFMHRYLKKKAESRNITVDILECEGENIGLEDASADAVVGTLVLCSVSDQQKVLLEILRILKPGGMYCFIEHVAAREESLLRTIQKLLRPVWKFANDGCRPDRDTLEVIRGAGFASVEAESFRVGAPVVSPHIAGKAVK